MPNLLFSLSLSRSFFLPLFSLFIRVIFPLINFLLFYSPTLLPTLIPSRAQLERFELQPRTLSCSMLSTSSGSSAVHYVHIFRVSLAPRAAFSSRCVTRNGIFHGVPQKNKLLCVCALSPFRAFPLKLPYPSFRSFLSTSAFLLLSIRAFSI